MLKQTDGFLVDWEPEQSPCIQKEYLVEYEQTNLDQCDTTSAGNIISVGRVKSTNFTIEGLGYYSTYTFYVSSILNGTYNGTRSLGVTVSTGERGNGVHNHCMSMSCRGHEVCFVLSSSLSSSSSSSSSSSIIIIIIVVIIIRRCWSPSSADTETLAEYHHFNAINSLRVPGSW